MSVVLEVEGLHELGEPHLRHEAPVVAIAIGPNDGARGSFPPVEYWFMLLYLSSDIPMSRACNRRSTSGSVGFQAKRASSCCDDKDPSTRTPYSHLDLYPYNCNER
jgi:hypothetical protein